MMAIVRASQAGPRGPEIPSLSGPADSSEARTVTIDVTWAAAMIAATVGTTHADGARTPARSAHPKRRMGMTTARGRAYLEAASARWQRLSDTVGLILGMAEGGPR